MMKQNLQDKGLKKALGEAPGRLPSNFVFRTMQKVDEEVRIREKRQSRNQLWAALVFSGILCGSGCLVVTYCGGVELHWDGDALFSSLAVWTQLPFYYKAFPPMVLLLLLFDHWMRKWLPRDKSGS